MEAAAHYSTNRFFRAAKPWLAAVPLGFTLVVLVGCSQPAMRLQSPEAFDAAVSDVKLIRDVSVPFGLHPLQVESAAIVANLPGTGGDPPPGALRAGLIAEIQKRGVSKPNKLLSGPNTAPVLVRALLPPGLQQGDRFDVEIVALGRSDTKSLRDGTLLEVGLRENALLNGRNHQGHVTAKARGPVVVDPFAKGESDPDSLLVGRIIGGGIATKNRPIGLVLRSGQKSVRTSQQIGNSLNHRFHYYTGGVKTGIAKPKTDTYIDLTVHPRYKDNIPRFVKVLQSVAISESQAQREMRIRVLSRRLLDLASSSGAALQLEAIGPEAVDALKQGLAAEDAEVRFYAAEALAYLDDPAAAEGLAKAARDESAFRAHALTALSAMDDPSAREALASLLNDSSAETRYGAFRALWAMNPRDPLIRGQQIGGRCKLHHIRSKGPVMIHMARSSRPEIVFFGKPQVLKTPLVLDVGSHLMVTSKPDGQLVVSRFAPGQSDQTREVGPRIDEVARAILELGGTYPELLRTLSQAKETGLLTCRLEIDAVPRKNRPYQRATPKGQQPAEALSEAQPLDSPKPDLYPEPAENRQSAKKSASAVSTSSAEEEAESSHTSHGFFGKMVRRLKPW